MHCSMALHLRYSHYIECWHLLPGWLTWQLAPLRCRQGSASQDNSAHFKTRTAVLTAFLSLPCRTWSIGVNHCKWLGEWQPNHTEHALPLQLYLKEAQAHAVYPSTMSGGPIACEMQLLPCGLHLYIA